MALEFLAPALGAVGSIVSGIFGNDEAEEARDLQNEQFERNIALQREFAQNGIRWKVDDARAAGLHPLAAIGMQGAAYSPVSTTPITAPTPDFGSMGQSIGRAIDATRTAEEKEDARDQELYNKRRQELELQNMQLRNELLGSQIAQVNQVQSAPPLPGATDRYFLKGQGNSPLIKDKPMERTLPAPEARSQEPGATTDIGFSYTVNGGYAPVMSKDVKDKLEEDMLGTFGWNVRNRLLPMVGINKNPPPFSAGEGRVWYFDPVNQEYKTMAAPRWRGRKGQLGSEAGWHRSFGGR